MNPFKLIDLTHVLDNAIPTWTNECGFFAKITDYEKPTFRIRATEYTMTASAGTHMDAPLHFLKNGMSIAEIEVSKLFCPLHVIDVRHKMDPNLLVSVDDIIEYENNYGTIKPASFVAISTGWDQFWNDSARYRNVVKGKMQFPGISPDASDYLIKKNVNGIGIDTLSPDGEDDFPAHLIILGAGKYIVENLTNLSLMPPTDASVVIAPLKINNGTESPIRMLGMIKAS